MRFIGITGGVGAGKSLIMDYLSKKPRTAVLYSDRFAGELEQPGQACYQFIKKAFPDPALYNADGTMNRPAFAALVFKKPAALDTLNSIVHPAIREAIHFDVAEKRESGEYDFYFLEAASAGSSAPPLIRDAGAFRRAGATAAKKLTVF